MPGYAPPSTPLPGYGAPAPVSQFQVSLAAPQVEQTAVARQWYLVAGIGAAVALIAFFVIPYAGAGVSYSGLAAQVCGNSCPPATSTSTTGLGAVSSDGLALLVPLLALLIGALAFLPATRNRAFGFLTSRNGAIATLAAAGLGLLILLVMWGQANNAGQDSGIFGSLASATGVQYWAGVEIGFWLMLLGFVAAIVGGIMVYRDVQAQAAAVTSAAMPAQQPPLAAPMPPMPGSTPPTSGMPAQPATPPPSAQQGAWPPANPQS